MTEEILFNENITLSTEFNKYLLEHPEIAEKIPIEAQIVLLPEYNKELYNENLRIAQKRKETNRPVVYIRIKKMLPEIKSRIENVELEVVK